MNACEQKVIIAGNCINNGCTDENYECISKKCVYKHANGLIFDVKTTFADQTISFYQEVANKAEGLVADCGEDGKVVDLIRCKYATPGMHTMSIFGRVNTFQLNALSQSTGFIELKQWGKDNHWTTCESMFDSAENFTTISDPNAPDLRRVTDMRYMFNKSTMFNSPVNHWDVSNVFLMSDMFSGAATFNQDLSNWTVFRVTDMRRMFSNADSFQTPIIGWELKETVATDDMFYNCPLKCSDFRPNTSPLEVNHANFDCVD